MSGHPLLGAHGEMLSAANCCLTKMMNGMQLGELCVAEKVASRARFSAGHCTTRPLMRKTNVLRAFCPRTLMKPWTESGAAQLAAVIPFVGHQASHMCAMRAAEITQGTRETCQPELRILVRLAERSCCAEARLGRLERREKGPGSKRDPRQTPCCTGNSVFS